MGRGRDLQVKNSGLEGSGENMDINNFMSTKEYAKTLDQEDPLVSYREKFYLNLGMIYMDGNSLGLLSKRALEKFNEVIGRLEKVWDRWLDGGCRASRVSSGLVLSPLPQTFHASLKGEPCLIYGEFQFERHLPNWPG